MENVFELDIDIKKENYINQPVLKQNDYAVFKLNILDDEIPVDLSNAVSITLANFRPDRKSIVIIGSLGDSNNQAIFKINRPENALVGTVEATVQFYDADSRISTATFTYKVVKDPSNISLNSDDKTLVELVLGDGPTILTGAQQATQEALEAAEIARNAEGPEGPVGPKGETGEQGPEGPKGEKGEQGEIGPTGETGAGLTILGSYESEEELPETGELGNGYLINGYLFVWDGSAWQNVGNIKGPKGDPGEKGDRGPQGEKGLPGEKGEKGDSFTVNATGLLIEREQYDNEQSGFSFLATDTASLYIRLGAAGWSDAIPFGKGEQGPRGERGLQGEKGEPGEQGIKGETGEKGPPGEKGDTGTTSWTGLTDKPESFPPSTHDHPIEQIEGLQDALDEKASAISIGDLGTLETNEKESIVNAINEINAKPSGGGDNWILLQTFNPTATERFYSLNQQFTNYKKLKFVFKSLSGHHLIPNMVAGNPYFYFNSSWNYKRFGVRLNHQSGGAQTLVDNTAKLQWNALSATIGATSYPHWELNGEMIFEKKEYKSDDGFGFMPKMLEATSILVVRDPSTGTQNRMYEESFYKFGIELNMDFPGAIGFGSGRNEGNTRGTIEVWGVPNA